MKKLCFALGVLALTLVLVGDVFAQANPVFNEAWLVKSKVAFSASSTNDTTQYINLTSGGSNRKVGTYDLSWFLRSNDSLDVHIYYQLKNAGSNYTGAWVLADSCVTVDDAGAATDTTTIGVNAANNLTPAVLKGASMIRFYFAYKNFAKTCATSGADGTATLMRFYVYLKPLFKGID